MVYARPAKDGKKVFLNEHAIQKGRKQGSPFEQRTDLKNLRREGPNDEYANWHERMVAGTRKQGLS
jgi:hypothetical protein